MDLAKPPEPITAGDILDLLKTHWRKAKVYPDSFWCGHLAVALCTVRDRRPTPMPKEPEALKYGRLFVQHSDEMKRQLNREAAVYSYISVSADGAEELVVMDQARYDRCQAALSAVEAAIQPVTRALDSWKERDRLFIEDKDPAKFIYSKLQDAWASTGENVPKTINDNSPVCEFLADALAKANILVNQGKTKGMPYTAGGISAVLTGQTKRSNFTRG